MKNIGHDEHEPGIKREDLLKLISKTKIVLNLSKTRTTSVNNYASENVFKFYYQFKGRIIIAGLNGAACVSEYCPSQGLLFNNDEVPTFFTKEECVTILKKLLSNDELLQKYTSKFVSKTSDLCEDKKIFKNIYEVLQKNNHRKVKLFNIPYWYLRISAKQILLRNIKLTTLLKTLTQFNIIFSITKKSNLFIKLLILFESIINVIWYSLIFSVKSKK